MYESSPCTVVRDISFERSLRCLFNDWAQAEAYVAAVEQVLAHDPEYGILEANGYYYIPLAPVRGMYCYLYYRYNHPLVTLFEVEVAPE